MDKTIEKIVSLCKRRGFIFQSSDIYGGFSAVYDYGPLGIELKNNISHNTHVASELNSEQESASISQAILRVSKHAK